MGLENGGVDGKRKFHVVEGLSCRARIGFFKCLTAEPSACTSLKFG